MSEKKKDIRHGSKLRSLNKEEITRALRERFDFSDQLLNEIVEVVWNSWESNKQRKK